MKVIGAGLPRTGTLSQKVALEMLGLGPCYHMVNVLGDLDQVAPWRRAFEGEPVLMENLDGFQATVDWPGSFFYRELMEAYPEAKVLLSVRSGERWEHSMRETIWGVLYGDMLMRDLSQARGRVDVRWDAYTELMKEMWRQSGLLRGADDPEGEMAAAMERYNEEVQATVPPERLLVWTASDGWEPLCKFLGLPVPEAPFPHLNDSQGFADRVIDGAMMALQEWRTQTAPVAAAT